MKFLANENVPGDAVRALRSNGHDVVWVRESAPGAYDDLTEFGVRGNCISLAAPRA